MEKSSQVLSPSPVQTTVSGGGGGGLQLGTAIGCAVDGGGGERRGRAGPPPARQGAHRFGEDTAAERCFGEPPSGKNRCTKQQPQIWRPLSHKPHLWLANMFAQSLQLAPGICGLTPWPGSWNESCHTPSQFFFGFPCFCFGHLFYDVASILLIILLWSGQNDRKQKWREKWCENINFRKFNDEKIQLFREIGGNSPHFWGKIFSKKTASQNSKKSQNWSSGCLFLGIFILCAKFDYTCTWLSQGVKRVRGGNAGKRMMGKNGWFPIFLSFLSGLHFV